MEQHRTGGTAPPQPEDVDVERLAAWVGALAVVLVEMGQGMRPTRTLDAVATPAARRRIHRVARSGRRGPGHRVAPVRLIAVRGMQPTAGAYEAAVTVGVGARAIAVAARVEHDGAAWRIVELVPPEAGLHPAGRRPGRTDGTSDGTPVRPPTRD
jgi:hypothetical protein